MFKSNLNLTKSIGIDLGTATVLVYSQQSRGIIIAEPSVVVVDNNTEEIVTVGKEAQEMLGRTGENVKAIRPLKDGVINRYEITFKMLQYFIRKACGGRTFFPPKVVICVPSEITEVEERAVRDAAMEGGADKVDLIEEPLAAAIGAGLDIGEPCGNMVIDIGGGTTDIAVVSLGGIVVSDSIKVAGDKFDDAIMRYVRRKHGVLIGERSAEEIKKKIGAVYEHRRPKYVEAKGRCLDDGLPKVVTISSFEMIEAMIEPITAILDAVCSVIERTPPALLDDILKNGIVMTGGGSLIPGFSRLMEKATGIKTRVANDPVSCVALGTGISLEHPEYFYYTSKSLSSKSSRR